MSADYFFRALYSLPILVAASAFTNQPNNNLTQQNSQSLTLKSKDFKAPKEGIQPSIQNIHTKESLLGKKPPFEGKTLDEKVHLLLYVPLEQNYRIQSVFGEKEVELKVQAILNNKALIHHKWYKKGDKIGSFFIQNIGESEVLLVDKKSGHKVLQLQKKVLE